MPPGGGAGNPQPLRDGPDGWPALALPAAAILQIHIHRPGPVAQAGSVDQIKVSHFVPPPNLYAVRPEEHYATPGRIRSFSAWADDAGEWPAPVPFSPHRPSKGFAAGLFADVPSDFANT